MDRCELAMKYHDRGFNCCQSVLCACGDLTGLNEREALAIAGGLGRGVGGGEEICGAVTGAVMALSLLAPHTTENDAWEKQRIYGLSKKLQAKFREKFENLRCKDLLSQELVIDERFPTAKRLGLTKGCQVFIATAVELVEEMQGQIPQKTKA